jgi:hypothetical protein
MGRQKERALELSELARSILIHTGVATYCDDHNYLRWQDDKGAEEFAYALAANIVKRKQFRCDPVELANALTAEIRDLHDTCPDCPEDEAKLRPSRRKGRRAEGSRAA